MRLFGARKRGAFAARPIHESQKQIIPHSRATRVFRDPLRKRVSPARANNAARPSYGECLFTAKGAFVFKRASVIARARQQEPRSLLDK